MTGTTLQFTLTLIMDNNEGIMAVLASFNSFGVTLSGPQTGSIEL